MIRRNSKTTIYRRFALFFLLFLCLYKLTCSVQAVNEKETSVSVNVNEGARKYLDKLNENDGTLCYDLYKMADIETKNGSFRYNVTKQFFPMKEDILADSVNWALLAQEAFTLLYPHIEDFVNEPENAFYTGCALKKTMEIEPGMYLLLARGTKENSTVVWGNDIVMMDISEGSTLQSGRATHTLLGMNTFTVSPIIFSVPSKINDKGEIVNKTSDEGTWIYHQDIELKMEADPAVGSIEFSKTVVDYYGDVENTTFVFQVDAYFPTEDQLFSSEVYSMQFDSAGTKKIQVDGLPLGATIKITEIYSGVNYTASIKNPDSVNVMLDVNHMALEQDNQVFKNTYNGNKAGSGAVTNHFTFKDGEWHWEKVDDNISTSNGLTDALIEKIWKAEGENK